MFDEFWDVSDDSGEETWTTKEGQVIPYKKLEDSHLARIIRMLRRNISIVGRTYPQGEIAQDCAEQYIDQADDTLDGLEAEAARRGLRP